MTPTNERRRAERAAAVTARENAARAYFTGEGAVQRLALFVGGGMRRTATWYARSLLYASWALVAGIAIVALSPEHNDAWNDLYAWLLNTPQGELRTRIAVLASDVALELLKISVVVGYLDHLVQVTQPSAPTSMRPAVIHAT